ncbi:hypothetical protein [Rhizobium skierniewicense]|nr:hypothetical protein [Rhizobium skierniewicense]NTF32667.1 hypothetical protein [Rhizobium skierniewicense]
MNKDVGLACLKKRRNWPEAEFKRKKNTVSKPVSNETIPALAHFYS